MRLEGSGDRSLDTGVAIWDRRGLTDRVGWRGERSTVPAVWSGSSVVGVPAASRRSEHFKMAQLWHTPPAALGLPNPSAYRIGVSDTRVPGCRGWNRPPLAHPQLSNRVRFGLSFGFNEFQASPIHGTLAAGRVTKTNVHSPPPPTRTRERAVPRDVTKASPVPRTPVLGAFLWRWLPTRALTASLSSWRHASQLADSPPCFSLCI